MNTTEHSKSPFRLSPQAYSDTTTDGAVELTQRTKTIETLVAKIRGGSALSRIQDVVGARVVGEFLLSSQDRVVRNMVRMWGNARVEDRRARPNHGYRAVHVIITVDGFPIEIQVRTDWQHVWANATEILADRYGRAIRYGGDPVGKSDEEVAGARRFLAQWHTVAERIGAYEAALQRMANEVRWRRLDAPAKAGIEPDFPEVPRTFPTIAHRSEAVRAALREAVGPADGSLAQALRGAAGRTGREGALDMLLRR